MCLTHVMQHLVPLQLCVFDLVLQHHQLLLILLLESVQTSLAVLQLIYQLLLDGDLTGDVGQVGLDIFCSKNTPSDPNVADLKKKALHKWLALL